MKAWGITPKNNGQREALKALTDNSIDLVVLSGIAGSGKTLLALAAGLEQVIETKSYRDIIFTRAPVSVGDDLGYLPGDIDEKMYPWCGALFDNLDVLIGDEKLQKAFIQTKLKMTALQHMRGRSFNRRYVIIDEIQNISTEQLKVLLTRAGEDTKIVCLGDASQVDNKKLSVNNNALNTLINLGDREKFIKIIHLPDGERSRLCNWAANTL